MSNACQRAEVLAGAIALHEAGDNEREEYRRHIAACSSCLEGLGGEIAIERIMDTVREARDEETWQPVLASVHAKNERRVRALARTGLSVVAIAVVASIGVHSLVASSLGRIAATPSNPIVLDYDGTHITLEHRAAAHAAKARAIAAIPHIVVVHNVITLKPPPAARAEVAHSANSVLKTNTTVLAQVQQPSTKGVKSNVPIWRRGDPPPLRAIAAERTGASAVPLKLEGRAESIALTPSLSIRDVMPLGGESAINPQPPMIAYSEGAEGTTAFAVSVDERGMPVKCTITQSSGSVVLDEAVCKAAMKARFSPRMVNGRATPGIYRDAFTFRNSTNNDGIQEQKVP